jgi:Skp family chaperone for outer membrane proteins
MAKKTTTALLALAMGHTNATPSDQVQAAGEVCNIIDSHSDQIEMVAGKVGKLNKKFKKHAKASDEAKREQAELNAKQKAFNGEVAYTAINADTKANILILIGMGMAVYSASQKKDQPILAKTL